jgi:hypothetical protein
MDGGSPRPLCPWRTTRGIARHVQSDRAATPAPGRRGSRARGPVVALARALLCDHASALWPLWIWQSAQGLYRSDPACSTAAVNEPPRAQGRRIRRAAHVLLPRAKVPRSVEPVPEARWRDAICNMPCGVSSKIATDRIIAEPGLLYSWREAFAVITLPFPVLLLILQPASDFVRPRAETLQHLKMCPR